MFRLIPVFAALAVIPAAHTEQAASHLLGTWENSQECRSFPVSLTIRSVTATGADIVSTDTRGSVHIWTDQQTQIVYPPADPDHIRLKFDSFEVVGGQLRFTQVGPDGLSTCMFTRAGTTP